MEEEIESNIKKIIQEIQEKVIDNIIFEQWDIGKVKDQLLNMACINSLLYSDNMLSFAKGYVSNQSEYKKNYQQWSIVFLTLDNILLEYDIDSIKKEYDDDEISMISSLAIVKKYSFLSKLKIIFKEKSAQIPAIAIAVVFIEKVINALKKIWEFFLSIVGYVSELIDSEFLSKFIDNKAGQNSIVAMILGVFFTVVEALVDLIGFIIPYFRWVKNPEEELIKKMSKSRGDKDNKDSDTDLGLDLIDS